MRIGAAQRMKANRCCADWLSSKSTYQFGPHAEALIAILGILIAPPRPAINRGNASVLYLAETQKKSGFIGSGKAEFKLLACQRSEHEWSSVPNEEMIAAPR